MTTRLAKKLQDKRARLKAAQGAMVEGGAEDEARQKSLQDTEAWLRTIQAKARSKAKVASSSTRSSGRRSSGRRSSGRRSSSRRMRSPMKAADGRVVAALVGQPPRYVGGGRRRKVERRCRCTRRRCPRRRCTRRCCARRGRRCTRRTRCC